MILGFMRVVPAENEVAPVDNVPESDAVGVVLVPFYLVINVMGDDENDSEGK